MTEKLPGWVFWPLVVFLAPGLLVIFVLVIAYSYVTGWQPGPCQPPILGAIFITVGAIVAGGVWGSLIRYLIS